MPMPNDKEIYATMRNGKIAIIPKFIVSVANRAFSGNPNLGKIKLSNVHVVGEHAFYGCKKLKEIVFSDCLLKIGVGAFAHCASLEEIRLPDNVKVIEGSAFAHSGLKRVILPVKLEKLGCNVFSDCHALERVCFPEGITEITKAQNLFENCESLTSIFVCRDCKIENGSIPENCRVIYCTK